VVVRVKWHENVNQLLVVGLHGPCSERIDLLLEFRFVDEALGLDDVSQHLLDDGDLLQQTLELLVARLDPPGTEVFVLMQRVEDCIDLPAFSHVDILLKCVKEL